MRWSSELLALASGAVFAVGLALSGMTQPAKVVGFLDIGGAWDPSLAFVMGGAVMVHVVAYLVQGRMKAPLLGGTGWTLPRRTDIDGRLLGGAVLFGMGWALGGYCPGPALVSLPTFQPGIVVFAASMVAGMLLYQRIDLWLLAREERSRPPG